MRLRASALLVLVCSCCLALLGGCSGGDKTTGAGGHDDDGDEARFLLEGYFGGTVVEEGFGMWVSRLDPADPSAKDCEITINGQPLTLMSLLSTDEDAFYALTTMALEPQTQYAIRADLAGRTASCAFSAPDYPWITLASPTGESYYMPGAPVALSWSYDEGTPEHVYVGASANDGEEDVILLDVELPGTTTHYTIASTVTQQWASYDEVLVTVDGGEDAWPFVGDLAATGSAVVTVYSGDAEILVQGEEPEVVWFTTVTLDASVLDADGASATQARARVENESLQPCGDGTTVTFWAEPDGYVTIAPQTATTVGGEAVTTVTAGTAVPAGGAVAIHARAMEEEGQAPLSLDARLQIFVGAGVNPAISWTPNEEMIALVVRQDAVEVGNLRWSISGYFSSPVTYGTAPLNALQLYPPLGQVAQGLQNGTVYRILIADSQGDTTSYQFTR